MYEQYMLEQIIIMKVQLLFNSTSWSRWVACLSQFVSSFGLYHPLMLSAMSKAIIGINMLDIGDDQPSVINRCLKEVVQLTSQGVFTPTLSRVFYAADIAAAHEYLEKRKSIGKVVMKWS